VDAGFTGKHGPESKEKCSGTFAYGHYEIAPGRECTGTHLESGQDPSESEWIDNYKTIEQFMTTDLFTVGPDDVLELAANVMHWKHVRHVPVEDKKGRLVGIVSRRDVIELLALGKADLTRETAVEEIMKTDLVMITPETPTLEALYLMRDKNIGCLPVVQRGRLVGLITAYDFLTVSAKLLEERLVSIGSGQPSSQTKIVTENQRQDGDDTVGDLPDTDDLGLDLVPKARQAGRGTDK
jgi:FOG: CBS domain